MLDERFIQNWFTYHPPAPNQVQIYETIRAHGREFAHIINNLVPDGADKVTALEKLREAVMWANAALATTEDHAQILSDVVKEDARKRPAAARRASHQTTFWPQPAAGLPIVPKDGKAASTVSRTATRRQSTGRSMDALVDEFVANL